MRFFIALILFFPVLANATDILLTWNLPELREDGSQIEQIDRFNLYTTRDNVLQSTIEVPAGATSFQLPEVAPGNYTFQISTVESGQEGAKSDPISININDKIIAKAGKILLTIQVIE